MFPSKIFMHVLILSASSCLYGQGDENVDSNQESQQTTSQRPIEEIQVIGERTLLTMRNEIIREEENLYRIFNDCLLYTSPSPRDGLLSRMPSSA